MIKRNLLLAITLSVVVLAAGFAGGNKDSANKGTTGSEITTVKWFVAADWFNKNWNMNCAVDKMITDATGIKIEFISGSPEKLSALIAAGDLPDVITSEFNTPQASTLQVEGLVFPLDELIKKYTPNLKVPESMQKWHGLADGHFYGMVNFFYAPENLRAGENLPTHTIMIARQDLMTKLGISKDDFNTKKGTIAALKKVRDSGLKSNGFKIEPAYYTHDYLLQLFGASREDKNGNYVDREHEPQALESLKFLNEMYREKLLSEEFLILNDQQKKQRVGLGSVFSVNDSLYQNDQVEPLRTIDENAYFVEVGPVQSSLGTKTHVDPSNMAGWTTTMISKKAKNVEKIMKLFEYLYSGDEIHLNLYYGPRGITWDYDEAGRVKIFESVVKEISVDSTAASQKYGNDSLWFFYDWLPIMRTLPAATNKAEEARDHWVTYYETYSYPDLAFAKMMPDAGTDLAATFVRIDEYNKKMTAQMIMASSESEVEQLFNKMIAHKKQLGYDELFAYQSKMFKESKKKLGLTYAWPANK